MNDFFTWAYLATYAGSTFATAIITQFIKGVGFIDKIPTRFVSYIIAVIILVVASACTGVTEISKYALCLINAVLVSLAANGAFDLINTAKNKAAQTEQKNE